MSTVKSPDTVRLAKVPTDVTFGCAAVDKVPPKLVALRVPTFVIFPPLIRAVPSVIEEAVSSVNLPKEDETAIDAVK